VIGDALERVSRSGHTPTRVTLRDAIETTKIDTLQGTVSFDKNGDLASRIISVFQIKHDAAYPQDDMAHQLKYMGAAPQDSGA
jgi:branched-chain amino acid transport system substrate-binding protein